MEIFDCCSHDHADSLSQGYDYEDSLSQGFDQKDLLSQGFDHEDSLSQEFDHKDLLSQGFDHENSSMSNKKCKFILFLYQFNLILIMCDFFQSKQW